MAAGKTVTLRFYPMKALGRTRHRKEGFEQYNGESHEYHESERMRPSTLVAQPEQQNAKNNQHGGRENNRKPLEKNIEKRRGIALKRFYYTGGYQNGHGVPREIHVIPYISFWDIIGNNLGN